jgi:hypothetical protein
MVVVLVVLSLPFALTSCLNDGDTKSANEILQEDVAAIDAYLSDNNINAIKDPSGVRMAISVLGTGFPAQKNSKIDVDYVGKLFSDGSTFDQGNITTNLAGRYFRMADCFFNASCRVTGNFIYPFRMGLWR